MIEVSKVYPKERLSYQDFMKFMSEIPDERLIALCKECYDFKNGNGDYKGTELTELSKEVCIPNLRNLEEYVVFEATRRYKKVVSLLFADNPSMFLRKMSEEE